MNHYTIMVRWCFIIKLVIRIPYGKGEMMSSMSFTPHLLSLPLSRPTMLMSFKQTRISLILTWYVSKENYTWPNICHYYCLINTGDLSHISTLYVVFRIISIDPKTITNLARFAWYQLKMMKCWNGSWKKKKLKWT